MIRRSPAEYYIKYLLLLPDRLTDEDIIRTLKEHQLDFPDSKYIARLRASLKPPTPFHPMMETDLSSYRFLQKHKVHRLFFRDDNVTSAIHLLSIPRAKEVLESMLIVEESVFNICTRLRRFGIQATPKAVEYYAHFFFNTALVDPTELRALISLRVERLLLEGSDNEAVLQYKVMKQAMYSDPRFMVANSPTPQLAALRLHMRHGLRPTKIDHTRIADGVRIAALIAAHDALMRGGPKSAAEARDLSMVAANMDAVLRENTDASLVQKELLALAVDESKVPNIKQLTAGSYTDSVELVKDAADDKS